MRILFICGCLESGKDGVGDYTRVLAANLTTHALEVAIVAINDKYVKKEIESLSSENEKIKTLRLPSNLTWKKRTELVKIFLKSFNPDWLSFQFVPYAFQVKGISWRIPFFLQKIKVTGKSHVMFHEIWQGESKESVLKHKIIGYLQRKVCHSLLRISDATSTTNIFYQKALEKHGNNILKIPVYSNIPREINSNGGILEKLPRNLREERDKFIIASFFGGLHYHDNLSANIAELAKKIENDLGKKLIIMHIGKDNTARQSLEKIKAINTEIEIVILGECSQEQVAYYLKRIDIGLSNYPKILYEKSGSIAAMLYNGIPVILLKDSFEYDYRIIPELKELKEIKDIKEFLEQKKNFFVNYGVINASREYLKIFSK